MSSPKTRRDVFGRNTQHEPTNLLFSLIGNWLILRDFGGAEVPYAKSP